MLDESMCHFRDVGSTLSLLLYFRCTSCAPVQRKYAVAVHIVKTRHEKSTQNFFELMASYPFCLGNCMTLLHGRMGALRVNTTKHDFYMSTHNYQEFKSHSNCDLFLIKV